AQARELAAEASASVRAAADGVWAVGTYFSGDPAGLDVAEAAATARGGRAVLAASGRSLVGHRGAVCRPGAVGGAVRRRGAVAGRHRRDRRTALGSDGDCDIPAVPRPGQLAARSARRGAGLFGAP